MSNLRPERRRLSRWFKPLKWRGNSVRSLRPAYDHQDSVTPVTEVNPPYVCMANGMIRHVSTKA